MANTEVSTEPNHPAWPDSLWAAVTPAGRTYEALTGDITTDAVVIGAGFTGLSTALHLAKAGVDVCVLEAVGPGWGASGRNNGQVIPTLTRPEPDDIIARHQEVRAAQDENLERWTARGRIDFHFKMAQSGNTVDVSIDSNYFWERGGRLEWEQTNYYINGNQVRWKSIPELPLIQPEKVIT